MKSSNSQESVREGHFPHVAHQRVVEEISVNEEEDGEVDLFAGEDPLFLEAETFDFGEIWCDLCVCV